jgi:HSP20 family protein
MPFYRQVYFSPEAQFLQLLAEIDQSQQKSPATQQVKTQHYTPRFDVNEGSQAYELFGELPGVEQKDISIEFTDVQTVVIKGKADRVPVTAAPAAATTQSETDASSEKGKSATVEEDYDETDTPLTTPAAENAPAPQAEAENNSKSWISERKVGTFGRKFTFPQRIEQDNVQAVLKNGILHVVIPKSQKSRTVPVSVF